jgi:hypothetical protein
LRYDTFDWQKLHNGHRGIFKESSYCNDLAKIGTNPRVCNLL